MLKSPNSTFPALPGAPARCDMLLDELRVLAWARPATIARKLAAIAVYHRLTDHPTPTLCGGRYGTRRQLGVAQRQKTAHEIAFSSYYIVDPKSSICFGVAAARRTLRSHGGKKSRSSAADHGILSGSDVTPHPSGGLHAQSGRFRARRAAAPHV
jgi:hypothetical protein